MSYHEAIFRDSGFLSTLKNQGAKRLNLMALGRCPGWLEERNLVYGAIAA